MQEHHVNLVHISDTSANTLKHIYVSCVWKPLFILQTLYGTLSANSFDNYFKRSSSKPPILHQMDLAAPCKHQDELQAAQVADQAHASN